ncbi:presequence protease, mitochondrial-like [Paramacrobiotus metropolitanus]|uniref:presequence protease, mitochondrial-like n=1 Tax=Paramacrobiotus metropolitanus TaxID=2943436 RepID=UPI002446257B|nr:presequence protease, mitochondrial-like [Paramacrobiotus metropolitanus]
MSVMRMLGRAPASSILQCRTQIFSSLNQRPYVLFPSHHSSQIPSPPAAKPAADPLQHDYPVDRRIGGFTVLRSQSIPELALTAVHLEHSATGAQHLHLARADRNNVFAVAFRTPPRDSTGVAHILEHTVLCGSRRFPVRDPFFNMLNRSLSTFMNALTSSDWTMYPFSTLNRKDFQNLLSVYMDAAFFPNLRNVDFRQEGIRLEPADLTDPASALAFKGVVFNEMKGVFSNAENVYARRIHNYLLPSGTYGVESGGDPLDIPSLTWEQLRSFHKAYYHPSNARFYSYGDMPLEGHLDFLETTVLKHFHKEPIDSQVKPEPRWTQPREFTIAGPVNPLAPADKQVTVSVSYLWPEVLNALDNFCMGVVAKLLVSGPKAPFYAALLQSGLGSDYSPGTGLDNSIREGVFSVGLKNVAEQDTQQIVSTIRATIDHVVKTGFDAERVEAIIHEVELYLRHQTTSFGLHTLFGLMSSWNHDADPIQHLQVNQIVDQFRQAMSNDPEFLQKKVKEYLLDNAHNVTLVMKPDTAYEEQLKEKESQLLAEKTAGIDAATRQRLLEEARELEEEQNKKPDVSVLPTLKISDIESSLPRVNIKEINYENTPIMCVSAPTNGVTYFRSLISTEALHEELRPYVPLFCQIATKMGAGEMDYRQLSQAIELKTGGLAVSEHASHLFSSTDKYEQGVLLGSFCLDRNIGAMFGLWKDIFNRIRLQDLQQFAVLLKQMSADMIASLADSGHSYAMSYSASQLRPAARLREEWSGLQQINFLRPLAEAGDLRPTLDKMRLIAKHLLTNGRMRCSLNTTPATMKGALDELGEFLSAVEDNYELQHVVSDPGFQKRSGQRTHLTFPFAVHYASRCFPVPAFVHADYAALRVLGRLLSAKFLHKEIREKGGAYGGGARLAQDGLFNFYSYRDPKSLETFEAFERSVEWAMNGSFGTQDVDEAKLSVFQEVDKPVSPGDEGRRQFIYAVDDDLYQRHREQLLAVTKEQLVEVTGKYLADGEKAVSTLLGAADAEAAGRGWTVVAGGEEGAEKM